MYAIALSVILAVCEAFFPSPRQAADKPTGRADSVQQQPADKHKHTAAPMVVGSVTADENKNSRQTQPDVDEPKTVIISETAPVSKDWWDRLYVIFTGLLVAIAAVGTRFALRTLRALEKQTQALERQTQHVARQALSMRRQTTLLRKSAKATIRSADAYIRAERAWLFAEFVPAANLYSDGRWYRYSAEGRPIGMSDKEVAAGEHLRQTIRITNMGRTPGVITKYEIKVIHTKEKSTASAEMVISAQPYHSIAGEKSIDIHWDTVDVFKFIKGRTNAVLFTGKITYRHIFDKTGTEAEGFAYIYDPAVDKQLRRIVGGPWDQYKEQDQAN